MAQLVRDEDAEQRRSKGNPAPQRAGLIDEKIPWADQRIGVGLVGAGPENGKHGQREQNRRKHEGGKGRALILLPLLILLLITLDRNQIILDRRPPRVITIHVHAPASQDTPNGSFESENIFAGGSGFCAQDRRHDSASVCQVAGKLTSCIITRAGLHVPSRVYTHCRMRKKAGQPDGSEIRHAKKNARHVCGRHRRTFSAPCYVEKGLCSSSSLTVVAGPCPGKSTVSGARVSTRSRTDCK